MKQKILKRFYVRSAVLLFIFKWNIIIIRKNKKITAFFEEVRDVSCILPSTAEDWKLFLCNDTASILGSSRWSRRVRDEPDFQRRSSEFVRKSPRDDNDFKTTIFYFYPRDLTQNTKIDVFRPEASFNGSGHDRSYNS